MHTHVWRADRGPKRISRRRGQSTRSVPTTTATIAGLTLDRYGHLYASDAEAVGAAMNRL
jgi:hypothetical protein